MGGLWHCFPHINPCPVHTVKDHQFFLSHIEWANARVPPTLFPAELGGHVEGLERLERLRREWRVLGLLGYLLPAELGGLLEGLERLERRGACWACWGTFCLRSWAFCMRECAELGGLLEGLERLERLRPVKRQPGTPIRSHCCGRGDALSHCCGLVVAFACGRGACWACWGTVCLRSWAFCMREWRVLGYVQANGRLQRWNSRGWRLQGLVQPAGGVLEAL